MSSQFDQQNQKITMQHNTINGIDPERYEALVEEFGVTKFALKGFFKILQQDHSLGDDLYENLREIAKLHRDLLANLEKLESSDPRVATWRHEAESAIEQGDYDQAERCLAEAQLRDEQAADHMDDQLEIMLAALETRKRSAAASAAALGELKQTQLMYRESAEHYQNAAEVIEALLQRVPSEESQHLLVEYLNFSGSQFLGSGNYSQAESLLEKSLLLREQLFEENSLEVALGLNNLAVLYGDKGEYKKALFLYERVLLIREKILGKDHHLVGTTLSNLAGLYESMGKYNQSLFVYERALFIKERALGKDHHLVGTTLNNLAELYRVKGEYEKALPLYERSLSINENFLGKDHPSVGTILNNLAVLYGDKGENENALLLCERALLIQKKILGRDHPDVGVILNNLAELYGDKGEYDEMLSLHEEMLPIFFKRLGKQHPNTKVGMKNYFVALMGNQNDDSQEALTTFIHFIAQYLSREEIDAFLEEVEQQ